MTDDHIDVIAGKRHQFLGKIKGHHEGRSRQRLVAG